MRAQAPIQAKSSGPSITPAPSVLLQRKCACGGSPGASGECEDCQKKRLDLQRKEAGVGGPATAPPIVHEVLSSSGRPLDREARSFMEPRFGHDFSSVRVHADSKAAESARAVDAHAYTVGRNIVFDKGQFSPETQEGRRLLAHELAHTIQQGAVDQEMLTERAAFLTSSTADDAERDADHAAEDAIAGQRTGVAANMQSAPMLQRQGFHTPPVSVRSPVFEETVTQLTELMPGRPLTRAERDLVRGVFVTSIDYSRVRLIPTPILEYRTVANSIRVPTDFTINDEAMAQTLIHEMTHVWQYQHGGTSYISISLGTQIAAQISHGSRDVAYAYQINAGQSFFDFTPEQQASLVADYSAMLRDQAAIPRDQAAGRVRTYASNNLNSRGFLAAADRLSEISSELPLYEPLIRQMRAALPRPEAGLLLQRATEVMQTPGQGMAPVVDELQIVPVRPLLELRFPGL